jgi:hypothetical protein
MSKFANIFLKTLNEEQEGNAFTGLLHKDRDAKGKAIKKVDKLPDGKKIKIKSGNPVDENNSKWAPEDKHMTAAQKKKRSELTKELPTSAFTAKYGKKKGKAIKYATATKMTLKEDAEIAPAQVAPADDDAVAWQKSLDKNTDPKAFDVADNPQLAVDASGIEAARGWIKKLEEMASFVNATGPESLNHQINQLEMKNSVPFRGIVRREEKRITKVAENLRGLAEVFKSVINTSEKKIKDATAPR